MTLQCVFCQCLHSNRGHMNYNHLTSQFLQTEWIPSQQKLLGAGCQHVTVGCSRAGLMASPSSTWLLHKECVSASLPGNHMGFCVSESWHVTWSPHLWRDYFMSCHQIVQYPLRGRTVRQLLTLTGLKGRRGSINAPAFQIDPLVKAIQKGNVSEQTRENNKQEQKLWTERNFTIATSHVTSVEQTGRWHTLQHRACSLTPLAGIKNIWQKEETKWA